MEPFAAEWPPSNRSVPPTGAEESESIWSKNLKQVTIETSYTHPGLQPPLLWRGMKSASTRSPPVEGNSRRPNGYQRVQRSVLTARRPTNPLLWRGAGTANKSPPLEGCRNGRAGSPAPHKTVLQSLNAISTKYTTLKPNE